MPGLRTCARSLMRDVERARTGVPARVGELDPAAEQRAACAARAFEERIAAAVAAAEAQTLERIAAQPAPDPDRPGRIRTVEELRARMETRALELGHDPDTARALAGYTKQNEGWVAGPPDLAMFAAAGGAALARLDPGTARPAIGDRARDLARRLLELPVSLDGTVWLPVQTGSAAGGQVAYLHAVGAVEWHKETGNRRRTGYRVTLRLDHPWWERIR